MKAVMITPGRPGSDRLAEVPDPSPGVGEVLVEVLAVGVDGTDDELVSGAYGQPPAGEQQLIIGHESLGRVREPAGGLRAGQLVAAIVRRPDPVPCLNCAHDEWDYCLNGRYTERGIKGRHGFLAEYYTERPEYLLAVPDELAGVGMVVEPTTIGEKALEQIDTIQQRMTWQPSRALVTGAGPIGLLAAALLALRGLEVIVYDKAAAGPKVELAGELGARYVHADRVPLGHELAEAFGPIDIAIEATGFSPLGFQLLDTIGPNGVAVLTGVSGGDRRAQLPVDHLNLETVLHNKVLVGTVNADRANFEAAVGDLVAVQRRWPGWLDRLITRRVGLARYAEALRRGPDDVKVVIDVADRADIVNRADIAGAADSDRSADHG
ncbi:glucose 1-dehydrogenase [Pseudonocardia nigra]|uniref:glucose 1-dehydrogenase n=1 Tax=Pseudonocardia nigra TaxID=1921578 RepID=UPI001C5E6626|nr:glucose 1-dehydrogenase [Pseudonocardia nigra]